VPRWSCAEIEHASNKKIGAVIHDADVVSGGYCQHTEGFGEMAEEENR
jgi:hypothetical protein